MFLKFLRSSEEFTNEANLGQEFPLLEAFKWELNFATAVYLLLSAVSFGSTTPLRKLPIPSKSLKLSPELFTVSSYYSFNVCGNAVMPSPPFLQFVMSIFSTFSSLIWLEIN